MRAMRTSITRMAQRMDTFEEKMDELLMLLRSSQSSPSVPVDDMLLSPCSTVTELHELDRSLGQQERRNKMQIFLTTFGGSTGGTAIRCMLRRVATNDVVKPYSLQGRKTKKAFQDLTICRVITAASQKNFPALTAADMDTWRPLTISNSPVSKVDSFKFLGSIISQDLKSESNILKKAQQRMYFLQQLRKHGLPQEQELLATFYTASVGQVTSKM
ncbi:uncharacterized protein LOC120569405 [Perca fluviatilis]|uniref:uncharacterized protein LOC120569405 n=1 Tax=Perca fluviatilis TaxID=8168 RepID=UPI001964EB1F|nr:uncharacterized protein LOC120569405 [Perca fluviatilis]